MCDANCVNGCTTPGNFRLGKRQGEKLLANHDWPNRFLDYFCSEECANEMSMEDSEGTYCHFPTAPNAPTQSQIEYNRSYINPDDCYGSRPGERGYCDGEY